jgi:hypothetical protein
MRDRSLVLVVVLMSFAGCEACGGPRTGDECTFDGTSLEVGDSIDSDDGCNTCICAPGRTLECTDFDCAGRDGGRDDDDGGEEPFDSGRPPSSCVDRDDDGFFTCTDPNYPERPEAIDCDDERFYVQPGGYDFPDNGEDDDCDEAIDELPGCACSSSTNAGDLLAAMDLCDGTLASSAKTGDAQQFAVYQDAYFGIAPEGADAGVPSCLVAMSTGDALADDADELSIQHCDSFTDGCFPDPDPNAASSSRVFDLATLTLHLDVPPNARGLSLRFMFMSSEWPEYLCQTYNDTFYAIVESDAVAAREPTNFAFDPNSRPITVNVGFFEAPRDWTEDLSSTPFGASDSFAACTDEGSAVEGCVLPEYCDTALPADLRFTGSGSGWLTASSPASPGEQDLVLKLTVHDEDDGLLDSLVLLDRLRWLPYEPPLGVVKE